MTPKRNHPMRVADVMRVIEEARYPVPARPPGDCPAPTPPRDAITRVTASDDDAN